MWNLPKRKRSRLGNAYILNKNVTTKYFIPSLQYDSEGNLPVYKNLFVRALAVSRDRVQLLAKELHGGSYCSFGSQVVIEDLLRKLKSLSNQSRC